MYHHILKRTARKNFERVHQKDYDGILRDCVPSIHHSFGGNHALSGERHDHEAPGQRLKRLGRLGPGPPLLVHDVWVKGLPDETTINVRWSATDTRVDGYKDNNHSVHSTRMCWFKVVDIDANEDSQAVVESLKL